MDPRLCNSSSQTSMYSHYHQKIQPQAPPPHSASCNMRISKCASALRKNTTSASCDDHHECKWSIALVDGRKNTTSASCTVSRPSWAQVYRNEMQQPNAACIRAPPQCKYCPCVTCIYAAFCSCRLVPKMVLTLCNLRWWCFSFHQLAQYSTCTHGGHRNLRRWCFSLEH